MESTFSKWDGAPSYVNSVNCPEFSYIYRLRDPRDGLVRYVGCCSNPYWTEMRHRSISTTGKTQPKLKAWISELRSLGLRPEFRILQKVLHRDGHVIETNYIRSFHESAPGQLLNTVQLYGIQEGSLRSAMRRLRSLDEQAA